MTEPITRRPGETGDEQNQRLIDQARAFLGSGLDFPEGQGPPPELGGAGVPAAYQTALDAALAALENPSGISEERRQEIIDYYLKPYLSIAKMERAKINAMFRERGTFASGRHAQAIQAQWEASERQIGESVLAPLTIDEIRREGTERRANIQLVADLSRQGWEREVAEAQLTGTYRGDPILQLKLANMSDQLQRDLVSGWDREVTFAGRHDRDATRLRHVRTRPAPPGRPAAAREVDGGRFPLGGSGDRRGSARTRRRRADARQPGTGRN